MKACYSVADTQDETLLKSSDELVKSQRKVFVCGFLMRRCHFYWHRLDYKEKSLMQRSSRVSFRCWSLSSRRSQVAAPASIGLTSWLISRHFFLFSSAFHIKQRAISIRATWVSKTMLTLPLALHASLLSQLPERLANVSRCLDPSLVQPNWCSCSPLLSAVTPTFRNPKGSAALLCRCHSTSRFVCAGLFHLNQWNIASLRVRSGASLRRNLEINLREIIATSDQV